MENHKIRLVSLDVDGTLLNEQSKLTQGVINAIRNAAHAGLQLVIATGRSYCSSSFILDELKVPYILISSGGAQIRMEDRITDNFSLTPEQAAQVSELALSSHSGLYIDQPHRDVWLGEESLAKLYSHVFFGEKAESLEAALHPTPLQMSIVNDPSLLEQFRQHLSAAYSDIHMACPYENVMDVTSAGATKGNALRIVCDRLGIGMDEVAAVGDSENDLSMFAVSALTIAMGNAFESVKQVANWVAPTNDQDGAAWALEKIGAQ